MQAKDSLAESHTDLPGRPHNTGRPNTSAGGLKKTTLLRSQTTLQGVPGRRSSLRSRQDGCFGRQRLRSDTETAPRAQDAAKLLRNASQAQRVPSSGAHQGHTDHLTHQNLPLEPISPWRVTMNERINHKQARPRDSSCRTQPVSESQSSYVE